ncbi:ABC transporter permease [Paraburkholderia humisilvae]|uniref:Spermidine/putrescine transport system permease protein PotB n=1 Tax=Paraburkholderia humisilvae TaxID=627669 RepID=A0A6J5DC53_9BURK|nr:ABC transporter permease [Paraburkholderia humisilvae]CAB3751819.1 Spermidine/putrescine transport system permease protein PotB [Paraburkholderia humisilvae]
MREMPDHLLAVLPASWLTVFFLVPLGFTAVFSFGHATFGGVQPGFTLDNYAAALTGFYGETFARTLRFAATASLLCVCVAYPAAYFIAFHARRRLFALIVILVPYFSSFLIRVMSLRIVLARHGIAETALNAVGLHAGALDVLDTPIAVFIGMVYVYLPIAIVPLAIVLERIPRELIDASEDLGATRWRTFSAVILPLSRPGIATALLLTAVPMLGEMVIPTLLGGGRGVLMGQAIAGQYLDAQNYALGSAMAMTVLAAVALLVAALARVTAGWAETGR